MPAAVKSNMASKRGVAAGCGFVGSMGIRYRYTEPKGKRPKLASVANDRQAMYARVSSAAQSICNVMCLIARHFGDDMSLELSQIREFVKKVVGVNRTVSFWFPIASIGMNGAFACHKDKRDTRTTIWASLQHGGITFPRYKLCVNLHPGES